MAVYQPEWATVNGKSQASDDDANVFVFPYTQNGEYKLNQSGKNPRASTTVTAAPDQWLSSTGTATVMAFWNSVAYFIPFNTSVTVPKTVYDILNADTQYTVT